MTLLASLDVQGAFTRCYHPLLLGGQQGVVVLTHNVSARDLAVCRVGHRHEHWANRKAAQEIKRGFGIFRIAAIVEGVVDCLSDSLAVGTNFDQSILRNWGCQCSCGYEIV